MTSQRIDDLIKVKQIEFAPQTKLPIQIDFYWRDVHLQSISQLSKSSIVISSEIIRELRYDILKLLLSELSIPITFTSYYQSQAVISSKIFLRGKIEQQIAQPYLQQPELLSSIVRSHYWIISFLLDSLEIKYASKSKLFAILLSFIGALLIATIVSLSPLSLLLKITTIFLLVIIWYWLCDRFTKQYLPKLILQQLLFGYLSCNPSRRKLGWRLWRYFG